MQSQVKKNKIDYLLALALVSLTLFVTPNISLDPVSIPKLWLLTTIGSAFIALFVFNIKTISQKISKIYLGVFFALLILLFLNFFTSKSPKSELLWGVAGRQTGLVAFTAFLMFLLAPVVFGRGLNLDFLIRIYVSLFGINLAYGYLQFFKKDPVSWVNQNSPIMGTFGDPEALSTFIGIGASFLLIIAVFGRLSNLKSISSIVIFGASLFLLLKNGAEEGLLVITSSLLIVGLIKVNQADISVVFKRIYYAFLPIVGLLVVAGSANVGPLAGALYKSSDAFRGDAWRAAWNMAKSNPLIGVGLDSFGNYYPRYRDHAAVARTSAWNITNSAHNLYIEIGATAGLLVAQIVILLFVLAIFKGFKTINRNSDLQVSQVAIFVGFVGFALQSFISTNNFVIGAWGWLFAGILLFISNEKKANQVSNVINTGHSETLKYRAIKYSAVSLAAIIGAVIGFLPLKANYDFRSAMSKGDAQAIYKAALEYPKDTSRMIYAAQIFYHNNLPDLALKMNQEVTKFNPRNIAAWVYVYNEKSTSIAKKASILKTLKVLDPLNPELK